MSMWENTVYIVFFLRLRYNYADLVMWDGSGFATAGKEDPAATGSYEREDEKTDGDTRGGTGGNPDPLT